MTLGAYLKQLREARGITRAGLARHVGIKQNTLIAIENDATANPGFFTVLDLCVALGVDAQLFERLDRPQPRKRRAGAAAGEEA